MKKQKLLIMLLILSLVLLGLIIALLILTVKTDTESPQKEDSSRAAVTAALSDQPLSVIETDQPSESENRNETGDTESEAVADPSLQDPVTGFVYPENPDRTFFREGFSKEPLTQAVKDRITGVSFHENDVITYEDLELLYVRYVDFEGENRTGPLICNKKISDDLLEIFAGLYDAAYPIESIRLIDDFSGNDDLSCEADNTSCFNYRPVPGSTNLSNHAKGLAIDINPFYNPYITHPDGGTKISPPGSEPYADRSGSCPYMIKEGDICYRLFTEHGFFWGGHWKSVKDYQHFQKTD